MIYFVIVVEAGAGLSDRKGTDEQKEAKQKRDRA